MKRLTIEEVKRRAKDLGTWEVLDAVYTNANIKLKCKCIKRGHIHSINGSDIQQNKGCPHCNKGNRLTIEEVKKRAKDMGIWEILDDRYKGCDEKLKCRCIKAGHVHYVAGTHIQQGTKCPYCSKKKLNIEEVKRRIKKAGIWEILDNVYVDRETKLLCKCILKGHEHKVSWNSLQGGAGCPYCNRGGTNNNLKHSIEYIRKEFAKEDYE